MKTIQLSPPQPTAIPNQNRIDIPSSVGKGGIDILPFASGLQLMFVDMQLKQPTVFQGFLEKPSVCFGFCLKGKFHYRPSCLDQPFTVNAGDSGFFYYPRSVEAFEKATDKQRLRIHLILESEHLFKVVHGDEDRFYPVLKSIEKKTPCRIGHNITPVMRAVLYQMLHCPYHGMTRQLFLEGKAMELLSHKMEQLKSGSISGTPMKSSDTERIHQAAQLLVHDLEHPPNIMTLANSVGLNRNKLHLCFRQVFGLSPFEFLRNQRLQTAMVLLQDSEINVTQAAMMVGYSNMSYFTRSFKSMFGITPSHLRKSPSTAPPN
ncbi:AraC family transcriptional regulator [uncultured Desulfobacter sp.]|uniref:helix-turn-helix transcriptional regulator n=1 Tax=uncultured Desulfobacter sp. TaxID=240139 RepID=UPI0029F59BE7|nr:AraC family transcriptional regulator [uncultured Desulfobacter sp.]